MNQANERVIPFLVAADKGRRADLSSPAGAWGPGGPTAGQWRGGEGATGAHWPQEIDSHRSGKVPLTEERWECILHLRDKYGQK